MYRPNRMPARRIGDHPLTDRERKGRWKERLRNDPAKLEQQKLRERERWHQRLANIRVNTAKDLDRRDLKAKRREWKERQRESRRKRKAEENVMTPPPTPGDRDDDNQVEPIPPTPHQPSSSNES